MGLSKIQPFFSKRRLKKLEKKLLSMHVDIPEIVWNWNLNQDESEVFACMAYDSIPAELKPNDMINPWDVHHQHIPEEGYEWAKKHIKQARAIEAEVKDYSRMQSWVLLVLIIHKHWEKLRSGDADFLPPGEAPLIWKDFVVEQPCMNSHGRFIPLLPSKNYRKKYK